MSQSRAADASPASREARHAAHADGALIPRVEGESQPTVPQRLEQACEDTRETVRDWAAERGAQARETLHGLGEQAQRLRHAARDSVVHRPLTALGLAALAGVGLVVLGSLMARGFGGPPR